MLVPGRVAIVLQRRRGRREAAWTSSRLVAGCKAARSRMKAACGPQKRPGFGGSAKLLC